MCKMRYYKLIEMFLIQKLFYFKQQKCMQKIEQLQNIKIKDES